MRAVRRQTDREATGTGARLAELLARLAAHPRRLAAERRALPAEARARLHRLLAEIDEIVLPRALEIFCDGQKVARLVVTHRHLVGIKMDGPSPAAPSAEAGLAACLARLSALPGDLSARVSHLPPSPGFDRSAVSAQTLAGLLGLVPAESAFERLLRLVAPISLASLHWRGQDRPDCSGDAGWCRLLQTEVERYRKLRRSAGETASIGPQGVSGHAVPVSAGHILLIAAEGDVGLAAIVARKDGLAAISTWQKAALIGKADAAT